MSTRTGHDVSGRRTSVLILVGRKGRVCSEVLSTKLSSEENYIMSKPLSSSCALSAIGIFLGLGFRNLQQKNAVLHIISNTNKKGQAKVAIGTINTCLDFADKTNSFFKTDYLSLALSVTEVVSELRLRNTATGERLVEYSARHGMIGRFPELPKRLLGREMTGEEVKLLTTAYTNDRASQCSSTEDKLKALAKRFLNREDANAIIGQLEDFKCEFESRIDW